LAQLERDRLSPPTEDESFNSMIVRVHALRLLGEHERALEILRGLKGRGVDDVREFFIHTNVAAIHADSENRKGAWRALRAAEHVARGLSPETTGTNLRGLREHLRRRVGPEPKPHLK
jgi:hypothetical protein